MSIISEKYKFVIKNVLEKAINRNINKVFENLATKNCIDNYIHIIKNIDNFTFDIAQSLFQELFLIVDDQFMKSDYRKKYYESEGFKTRSLWTCFGWITIKRRIYRHNVNKSYYIHADRYYGLPKREKYDPYVCSLIVDAISDNNSMIKVGRQIGEFIDKKVSIDNIKNEISRQQVKNIIKKASKRNIEEELIELDTPENVYVMADEKWVHNQREEDNKTMVKSVIVFDNKVNTSKQKAKKVRSKLINKHVISGIKSEIWQDTLSYIDYVYDEDKLKNIYILGDGAAWIKSGIKELKFNKNIKVTYCSDKFHPKLAICNITKDEFERKILTDYMINNIKKGFKSVCVALSVKYNNNSETILEKMNYILNNWYYIQNSYKKCMIGCSMESHISHIYASLYTSIPKGYKIDTLKFLIKLRDLKENKQNIRLLYLDTYKDKDFYSFDDIEYHQKKYNLLPALNGKNDGINNRLKQLLYV